ncbi:MAG: hypothetical protein QM650_15820 [Microlunatus sp.]
MTGVTSWPSRRRLWLRAACVIVAVLTYLNVWTVIAIQGLTDYGRYRQQEPGEPVHASGAEFRLVSLVQSSELMDEISGRPVPPAVNAVWVVARIDVTRSDSDEPLYCDFQLLGPNRRIWDPSSTYVSRELERRCPSPTEAKAAADSGPTYPLEIVFEVPENYAGQLAGVVVEDAISGGARQVLVPPN